MATVPKCFVEGKQLPSSNDTHYISTSVRSIIDKCTVCNTTGSVATLTLDIVVAAGSAGVTQRIISARSIAAGETYNCSEMVGHILNPGDSIQGLSGTASALTIRISGREISGI